MVDRRGIELFARDYPHDYPEVEAILLMHAHRLRSCEIPVVMRPRLTGESAISSTQSVYYMTRCCSRSSSACSERSPTWNAHAGLPRFTSSAARDERILLLHLRRGPANRGDRVSVAICLLVFELLRRKHVMERYAIVWLVACVTLLVLALWQGLLTKLSHAVGIHYPPSALFGVAFLFVLVLLMHFSMTISRLVDQNKMLAQRLALLQQRLDEQIEGEPSPGGDALPPARRFKARRRESCGAPEPAGATSASEHRHPQPLSEAPGEPG